MPKQRSETGCTGAALASHLLAPRSIAIIGASDDPSKTAGRPLRFLRQAGFDGTIYPVNGRRDIVLGERAWRSVSDLPECPEHALILTPTEAALEAVAECGRLGVPVATVLASGFSEAGQQGIEREARLRELARETGIRIVGPSSLGVVDLRSRLILTANAAFEEPDVPVGRTFVASQSGSMIGSIMSRGKARGIGFAGFVSVGGELDLSLGEICAATLDDPGIGSYLLFLESLRNSEALRAFALAAHARGKPVIAYKIGRSTEAAELALTHTGALAGDDDVADAFLAGLGIIRVDTLDGLLEAPLLAERLARDARSYAGARVGVVTTTGGGAAIAVDQLAVRGVSIAEPSEATRAALSAEGIDAPSGRIVDLTLAGTNYKTMKAALDILQAAPELDLLLAVVGSSARLHPHLAVQPIADSAGQAGAPIAAFLVPDAPEALGLLQAAGVPSFRTPEACADALAAVMQRKSPAGTAGAGAGIATGGRTLDEMQSYALLERLGIAHAPVVVLDADAAEVDVPFAFPVAVKLLSGEVTHKTELGGVMLDVSDRDALRSAIEAVKRRASAGRPGLAVSHVLVQQMTRGVGEVLCGYRVDKQVGPLIMVAMGGVFAEVYGDSALRLAPVDVDQARAMLAELKGLKTLQGFRGRPAGDLDALAAAVSAMSRLAEDPDVIEAEINPLIVRPAGEGVVAVDAVARVADGAHLGLVMR